MALTRTNYQDLVKDHLDATGSSRWSSSTINYALGNAGDGAWSLILGAAPTYRLGTRSVTTDSSGRILLTDLNSGAGDSKEWWYRILAVTDGSDQVWRLTDFQSVPTGTTANYAATYSRFMYLAGNYVQLLPVEGSASRTVTVNHKPTRIDSLAGDSSTYDFPDGHELVVVFRACQLLFPKGGAEMEAASYFGAMAQEAEFRMLAELGRSFAEPTVMGGDPAHWYGG